MVDKVSIVVTLVVVAAVVWTGVEVVRTYPTHAQSEYMNNSEQWCENRNGELYNAQSLVHGGLHCDLPNGTTVHMSDVEAVYPA